MGRGVQRQHLHCAKAQDGARRGVGRAFQEPGQHGVRRAEPTHRRPRQRQGARPVGTGKAVGQSGFIQHLPPLQRGEDQPDGAFSRP